VVDVQVAGRRHRLVANRRGYVDAVIDAELPPGWHDLPIRVHRGRPSELRVLVVGDEGTFGVVSDIDDTVMITHLPRPLLAAWNTLVLRESARVAVRGMAELYQGLLEQHPGAPVVYLSTGAWNVAPTLTRFLARNGFPEGPLLLTDWGPTNTGWVRSGRQHKEHTLRRLAQDLPNVRWLLIGDDGQHDPEIYEGFAAEHPHRVAGIAIRRLTATQQALTTTPTVHRTPTATVRTVAAKDGDGLAAAQRAAGLLEGRGPAGVYAPRPQPNCAIPRFAGRRTKRMAQVGDGKGARGRAGGRTRARPPLDYRVTVPRIRVVQVPPIQTAPVPAGSVSASTCTTPARPNRVPWVAV
jgi:phosphatidate phosphatase APP1